jgi:membrane protein YqaA with SNARE-associated domain
MTLHSEAPTPDEPPLAARRPNWLRRLYYWVLGWAETPYGTPALAVISFAESSFFPIPPDVLQIALSVSKPRRAYFYATVSAIASVLGGILGWMIGFALWSVVGDFFQSYVPGFSEKNFQHVGKLYEENAFFALLGAAFTPIPYKVFTVAAGVFHEFVPLTTLILASGIGRALRFYLVATVLYFCGPSARYLLERYFEWITLGLFILAVAGFLVIRFLV